jgi:hypothetical protein
MDWTSARERLGAELIGAREVIASRWRLRLVEAGAVPQCLDAVAAELVLQAGSALADELPVYTPWTLASGVLCLPASGSARTLVLELEALWKLMVEHITQIAFDPSEERIANTALRHQLAAALRGAFAEVLALMLEEPIDDANLRFGGVKLLCWTTDENRSEERAA